jgi:NAD-dependent SIR2 family protein deacetylase
MKSKKSRRRRLHNALWDLQSEYIRQKENGICFTCGVKKPWKEMNAGHFIHGDALDFDLRNIHCQCTRCNHHLSGNLIPYTQKMFQLYGEEIIEELACLKKKIFKPELSWYEEKIKEYKRILNEI